MTAVTSLRPSVWKTQEGQERTTWWVALEGLAGEVPCYDPRAGEALTIGQPLPEGWEIRTSTRGKPYLAPPRAPRPGSGGGGAAAWRNTREGHAAEQERMDRRTALMQAVALLGPGTAISEALRAAEELYAWLRETSGRGGGEGTEAGASGRSDGGAAEPAPGGGEEARHPSPPPSYQATPDDGHEHVWQPAPRRGWELCTSCGTARRA